MNNFQNRPTDTHAFASVSITVNLMTQKYAMLWYYTPSDGISKSFMQSLMVRNPSLSPKVMIFNGFRL